MTYPVYEVLERAFVVVGDDGDDVSMGRDVGEVHIQHRVDVGVVQRLAMGWGVQ